MTSPIPGRAAAVRDALLAHASLGARWKEIADLERVRALIPAGTRVHVGFRDTADMAMRVATARAISRSGFVPVPVIPARRLESEGMLRDYLSGLQAVGWTGSLLVVGGDPARPRGPFPDAGRVIGSGILEEHGVREVSVAGHPGGHPAVADPVLWQALADKAAAVERRGLRGGIVTQFGFDADEVLAWLADLRARGIGLPVRVGVPGPASVRRLWWYASQCGVNISAPVAGKYGLSLADPEGEAGPDGFIRALAAGHDTRRHGEMKLHFHTFAGIAVTAEWISRFRADAVYPF